MFKYSTSYLAAAFVAGGLVMGPASASAGDSAEGISRISDGGTQTAVQPAGRLVQAGAVVSSEFVSSDFAYSGYDSSWSNCGTDCYCDACLGAKWKKKGWLFSPGYCTHSPDHGWAVPRKNPIRRAGVEYQAMWPHQWYGLHSPNRPAPATVYPVVGMPTDTTQLGYYYQHVPQWRPIPGMIPPPPNPDMFHDRTVGSYGVDGTCPEWIPAGPTEVYPAPAEPSSEPPVPPAPGVSTARRASYEPGRF